MIFTVSQNVGDRLSVADTFQKLISLFANDFYARNKASGSLGGAVNGGTIYLDNNEYYERIR